MRSGSKWLTAATDEGDGGLKDVLPSVSAAVSLSTKTLSRLGDGVVSICDGSIC